MGAGVVGCSVAFHLAKFGAGRVTVLERRQVGARQGWCVAVT
jgi:glycine/D-amino acid oxidase-like deaminating enzyme